MANKASGAVRPSAKTSTGGSSTGASTSAGSSGGGGGGGAKASTAGFDAYGSYGSYGTGAGESAKFWEAAGAAFGSGSAAREPSPRLQAPVGPSFFAFSVPARLPACCPTTGLQSCSLHFS